MAADAAFRLLRELRSGLSKCPSEGSKIDFVHGIRVACDTNLIGIDSDFRIHVSDRLLEIHDGPFLELGLKGIAGTLIDRPRRLEDRFDRERLALRFSGFKKAARLPCAAGCSISRVASVVVPVACEVGHSCRLNADTSPLIHE